MVVLVFLPLGFHVISGTTTAPMLLLLLLLSHFSRVQLFATPWTVACQAPLSMEFSRQEYRSGLPYPPPGNLPDPGIEPMSLKSPVLEGLLLKLKLNTLAT